MSDPQRVAYCGACREGQWAESCAGCEWEHCPVVLMPENREALALWNAVATQWRGGGLGLIGLDYAEVRHWARDLDLDLSPCLWGKIRRLERHELERGARHATDPDRAGDSQAAAGHERPLQGREAGP